MTVGELRRFLNTLPLDSDTAEICVMDTDTIGVGADVELKYLPAGRKDAVSVLWVHVGGLF
jgi:hypothetical protein